MVGEMIVRFRWLLLLLLVLAVTGALVLLPDTRINQDFAGHFPDKDPELAYYQYMVAELGDEDDLLSVAVHSKAGIFDTVFLRKFHELTLALRKLPNVLEAESLTTLREIRRTPFGVISSPFLQLSKPGLYPADSVRLLRDERLTGRFLSTDTRTVAIVLELNKGMDARASEALVASVEQLGQQMGFAETYLMGRKYFEVTYNRISSQELIKSFLLCMGLIILLLLLLYRSFWPIFIPILIYLLAIILFLAYLVWRGHSVDAMSNLAPTILLIVSISDTIHFFSKYEDLVKEGLDKIAALKATINHIGFAIMLTSLTTAIGFLTMMMSDLPSLRKFGEEISVSILLVFLVTMILLPFVLYNIPASAIQIRPHWHRWWSATSGRIHKMLIKDSRWIVFVAVVLLIASLLGITRIGSNNYIFSSLPKDHPSTEFIHFYEDNLGGIRRFEIALTPKDGALLNDLRLLNEIEKLHQHVEKLPTINGLYSPVTYYKSLNKAWHGGQESQYLLPADQKHLEDQEVLLAKRTGTVFQRIINQEKTFGKLSGGMKDIGRQKVAVFNEETEEWINTNIDTSLLQTRIIGASAMVDKVQEHAIRNMFSGLALALMIVGGLIWLLYREWKIMLVVLITNIFPIIVTAAMMAILGIQLRYGTSIIFTIGFVIAVDDTIHFVGRFVKERHQTASISTAIANTLHGTGRAILLTSIVLFFGFGQLITSSFRDAQAVGILVSIMLIFAFLADVFLAPLLLLKLLGKDASARKKG
jgi:predicted RND superfamily exporter protein